MESTRKKSCRQCRIAKTRCSLTKPNCSRCISKRLTCNYENRHRSRSHTPNPAQAVEDDMFHSWLAATKPGLTSAFREDTAATQSKQTGGVPVPSSRFSELPDFDIPLDSSFGTDSHLWNSAGPRTSPTVRLFDFGLDGQAPEHLQQITEKDALDSACWFEASTQNPQRSPSVHRISINANDENAFVTNLLSAMKESSQSVMVEWRTLSNFKGYPNILNRKRPTKVSALTVGNFLWSTIESYATEFGASQLPPFIHRRNLTKELGGRDEDSANYPEPLANCEQIVPMFLHKTPSSKQLVMKTFILEVQRLHNEFHNYDEQTLLCTLQALIIYLVVLAADQDRCQIVSAVVRIAMGEVANAVKQGGYLSPSEIRGNFPKWDDWITAESKRRTLIIVQLADKLVDMSLGPSTSPSCSELKNIPLSCSKRMWAAETESAWECEYKRYLSSRTGSRILTFGDLIQSNELDVDSLEPDMIEDLSNWTKTVDSFGSLLLLGSVLRM